MKCTALAPLALLLTGLAQAGTVEISFDQPDRFTDAGHGIDAEAVRDNLTLYLRQLGQRELPAQQTLRIEITDIDLAGHLRPIVRAGQDVRVLGGTADWPRISLHYTLSEDDRVIASGDERVADMSYLMRPLRADSSIPLPYERRMLAAWFHARFGGQPGR